MHLVAILVSYIICGIPICAVAMCNLNTCDDKCRYLYDTIGKQSKRGCRCLYPVNNVCCNNERSCKSWCYNMTRSDCFNVRLGCISFRYL